MCGSGKTLPLGGSQGLDSLRSIALWTAGRMHRFALCVLLAPAAAALRRGDAAPAFVGENYDGQQVTLASATGPKGLVLWFYPKAGTGG